jgi:hypothetical protein
MPLLNKAIFGKRYIVPEGYPDQDEMNRTIFYEHCYPNLDNVLPLYLSLARDNPTYYVEKALGELLLESHLPEEMLVGDIVFPWPSFRLVLPKRLLYDEAEKVSISFIYITLLTQDEDVKLPEPIARELERAARKFNWTHRPPPSFATHLQSGKAGIRFFSRPENDCFYTFTKGFSPTDKLSVMLENPPDIFARGMSEEEFDFSKRIQHFAWNALLLFSAAPAVREPEQVQRAMRREGKRIIPALVRPHWLGDTLLTARRHGRVKDADAPITHKSPHWRRAHWRRQPCGTGFKERRLVWILPMHVGKAQAETALAFGEIK